MSYPKRLYSFRPIGGLVTDPLPSEVGPEHWTDGANVRMSLGLPERALGYREAYPSPTVPPLGLLSVQNPTSDYWVYVGASTQWVVDYKGHMNVTKVGGLSTQDDPGLHSLCSLNGIAVHNNALDAPMYWPGAADDEFVALPGWPTGDSCRRMISHLYHLFALDIDGAGGRFPSLLRWSDAAEPGTIPQVWTPSADNQAGSTELADTPGALMTAATLRDTLLVYKRDAVYAADYVGGDQVYAFRPLFRSVGTLSTRGVAVGPQGHVFVTDDDIVMTDGNGMRSLANSRVRNRLFDTLNQKRLNDLVAYYQPLRRETIIGYPVGDESYASQVLVWSHDNDAWSSGDGDYAADVGEGGVVDFDPAEVPTLTSWDEDPQAWDDATRVWNDNGLRFTRQLMGAYPKDVQLRLLDTDDLVVRSAFVEKADIHFDDPARFKYLRRVHVRWTGRGTMVVRIGARNRIDDPITWTSSTPLAPGQQVVNLRVLARYITVRLETNDNQPWRLGGFDLEVEMRGYQ